MYFKTIHKVFYGVYIVVLMMGTALYLNACQLLEVNIVQRSLMEEGQGLETTSVEQKLNKEESKMEFIVPMR